MINYKLFCGKEEINLNSFNLDNKLQSIDKFTSIFKDENELKLYLIKKGLLNNNISKINVIYKYKELKKLNVIYSKHITYFDPNNMENTFNYLNSVLLSLSSNKEFLNKLYNHYYRDNIQSSNILELKNCLMSGDIDNEICNILNNIYRCASISINKDGEVNYNYRGIRDLGLFIYRYMEKEKLTKEKEILLENSNKYNSEKQKQLEYIQLSMFDKIDE